MGLLENRKEAGQRLAERLKSESTTWRNAIILALPRGGVPVAHEISKQLGLPLDVLLVKKIGAPNQPEFAIGAISETSEPIWNAQALSKMNLDDEELSALAKEAQKKIQAQTRRWRRDRKPLSPTNRTVLLVDDGIATGMTVKAAIELLKKQGAKKVILAVPVSSSSAKRELEPLVDQLIVLETPTPFYSVGQWYNDFSQVSDDLVTKVLMSCV